MNLHHELASVGVGMHALARDIAKGDISTGRSVLRLAALADRVSGVAEALQPERPRLRGWRRLWFRLTRRSRFA